MSSTRPRGRRPGQSDTRQDILKAALTLFYRDGYDKVSLRAIARESDVDPALIHHYFDSKTDLFNQSVLNLNLPDATALVGTILDGDTDTVGERAIDAFLQIWATPGAKERFAAMLRASVEAQQAHRPFSEYLATEIFGKVAKAHNHRNAAERGELAVTLILGLVLSRDVMGFPAMRRIKTSQLRQATGQAMQAYLVESW